MFSLLAAAAMLQRRRFLARGTRTPGNVVGYKSETVESTDDDGRTRRTEFFYPIVRFTDAGGNERRALTTAGAVPPAFALGAAVTVVYDPADPEQAEIEFRQAWQGSRTMLAFGLGQVSIAVVLLFGAWLGY